MQGDKQKFFGEGLTFDDVLLVPAYSKKVPREVDTTTQLTRNIELNQPLVSAAMDTVTESQLAIAMARAGGLGFLHKNMSIEQQAREVRKVKRAESGLIIDPITLKKEAKVGEALQIMKDRKIGGIPIVNGDHKLQGIVTHRDLRFEQKMSRPVSEVMTPYDQLVTVPEGTTLEESKDILQKHKIEKLPVVEDGGELVGLITYKDILRVRRFPDACKDKLGRLLVGAAIGVTSDMKDRVAALAEEGVDVICIDTAHGHSKGVIEAVKSVRKDYSDLDIVAGNVGTEEGARGLMKAGVDAVKVGVGPGSICTTRVVTGAGMPQLTAIYEAKKAKADTGIPIIADGGVRYSGDIVKALVAGADTVMAGSLFAGVEESPGETIIYEGRKFKSYRGMGSIEAMQQGSKDRYFQDVEDDVRKLVPEGIVGRVPYKGTISEVMNQYEGGLRAGMGYCGAETVADLQKAQFVKITNSGVRESHAHDVTITREAPNYSP
jgi:IMP dehydrogenase